MTHPALSLAQKKISAGQSADALMTLSEALQKTPADRSLLHARAHLFISLGQPAQAANDLDKIIALAPQDAQALDDRGVLYQWQGDYLKAAECHMQAVDIAPSDGVILNLAIALNNLGQRAEAEKLYNVVLQINPLNTRAMINLAVLHDERGKYDEAEALLRQAAEEGDDSFEMAMTYGNVSRKQGRTDDALRWYEKAVLSRPDNGPAKFLLSLMKGENPEAPPPEHVASLFDSYADNFEASLVGQLQYRTPELLFDACKNELEALKASYTTVNSMDLGAGTGLFGKILRPYVTNSIGLDLSIKMLEKAQEQNVYDSILCMDMVDGLKKYPDGHFNIIAAADVFVYVGKLDELFAQISRSLAKDGLYIFSTEATEASEHENYHARDTGRYAHSETYLKNLIARHDFISIHFERTWIRYNKEKPLDGFIIVLKKK